MSYIDLEFAERALSSYPRFKVVRGTKFRVNCRCPICGDSKSDMLKARFWANELNDGVVVHCFNCDYTNSLHNFIKEEQPDLYREYIIEVRKSKFTESKKVVKEEVKEEKKVVEYLPYSVRIDTLPSDHKLIKYIEKRMIPKKYYSKIYFTKQWQELVNHINPDTFSKPKDEMRLVIPIFNKDSEIESIQGRSLEKDPKIKYMTIKAYESASKIYGMDDIDESKPVIIVEGPIDSMFIDNSIAITGGSLNLDSVPYEGNRIWALDNEPRHPDTMKRLRKLMSLGESVVFWDEWKYDGKDINKFVENGATSQEVLDYILNNNCSGLMAKLRYKKYCKI